MHFAICACILVKLSLSNLHRLLCCLYRWAWRCGTACDAPSPESIRNCRRAKGSITVRGNVAATEYREPESDNRQLVQEVEMLTPTLRVTLSVTLELCAVNRVLPWLERTSRRPTETREEGRERKTFLSASKTQRDPYGCKADRWIK